MVSPWGFLAGGLLSGVGAGMAEDGKAMRERALKELEHQWAGELVDKRIGAQIEEGRLDREFRAGEGDKTRTVTVDENAKDRAAREHLALAEKPSDAALKAAQANYYRTLAAQAGIKSDEVNSVQTAADGTLLIVTKSGKVVNTGITGKADKEPTEEIHDPTSPTGTRIVPRSQAYGQPGIPKGGMEITSTPGGGFSVKTGVKGTGNGGMSPTTKTGVEKQLLESGDTLGHLTSIQKKFKPEYQQLGTRWTNFVNAWRDKAGDTLDPADKKALTDYSAFRADATQNFALVLKDLSGVAVNPTEFKRAQAWLPNPGTGLFDGDSPVELESKLNRFVDFTRRALAKYNYINKKGLTVTDVDVDDMPEIMRKRGDEIAKEIGTSMSGDTLKRAVRDRLSDEFGLGVQR